MADKKVTIILGAVDKTKAAFGQVNSGLGGMVKNQASMAIGAAAMAAAVGVAVKVAIGHYASLQKAMAEVGTITDWNVEQTQRVKDAIVDLSSQYGLAAEDITRATYDIASAGFSGVEENIKVLDSTTRLAIAGLTDAATAADLVTTALNSYGLGADDAEAVSDKLFTTVRLGKTRIVELAESLGNVASTASSAGVPLDELLATISALTRNGVKTADAMTAVQAVVSAIAAPAGVAAKALEDAGISLDQGLVKALIDLSYVSDGSMAKLKEMVPNIRAVKAAAASVRDGGTDILSFQSAIETASGEVSGAAADMADTVDMESQRLSQSWKNMTAQMASNTAEDMADAKSSISDFLAWMTKIQRQGRDQALGRREIVAQGVLDRAGGARPDDSTFWHGREMREGIALAQEMWDDFQDSVYEFGSNAPVFSGALFPGMESDVLNAERLEQFNLRNEAAIDRIRGRNIGNMGADPSVAQDPITWEDAPEDLLLGADESFADLTDGEVADLMIALDQMKTPIEEIGDAASDMGQQIGSAFADAAIQMAIFNSDAGQVFKSLVAMTVRMAIVAALEHGGAVPMAQGGAVPMAQGGSIPHAAFGYSVPDGPRGLDSRLIAAMPGEEVINRQLSMRLNRFLSSAESSPPPGLMGGSMGGSVTLTTSLPVRRSDAILVARGVKNAMRDLERGVL